MPPDEVSAPARELLQRVVTGAIRMDSLIQDVLLLAAVIRQPVQPTDVDVDALVRTLISERSALAPPRAQIRIESPLRHVLAHKTMLTQCLMNVLGNAAKFVEAGQSAQIRVWTEEVTLPGTAAAGVSGAPARGAAEATRPGVRIWIEDEGIGVPSESRERIFEMFGRSHRAEYQGSGIGLVIVRRAIERMGGRVGVEPNTQKGSRFWLELPRA
jgi:signal transduction histidine kinase